VSRSAIRKGGEEASIIDLSGTLDKGILQEFRSYRSSGVQEAEESDISRSNGVLESWSVAPSLLFWVCPPILQLLNSCNS
jgi:hypothetical protein